MGRKTKKVPGALVELPARQRKGLGIIVKIATHEEAYAVYESFDRMNIDFDACDERALRLASAFSYYGIDSYSHNAKPRTKIRQYILVRWIKPPSQSTQKSLRAAEDWYPTSIIRVVSPVAHTQINKTK